jgi:hypothetical protein
MRSGSAEAGSTAILLHPLWGANRASYWLQSGSAQGSMEFGYNFSRCFKSRRVNSRQFA